MLSDDFWVFAQACTASPAPAQSPQDDTPVPIGPCNADYVSYTAINAAKNCHYVAEFFVRHYVLMRARMLRWGRLGEAGEAGDRGVGGGGWGGDRE